MRRRLSEEFRMTQNADLEAKVLDIVRKLCAEVNPRGNKTARIDLDSDLDRDGGLDSLARAELIFRIDTAFKVKLQDRVLIETNTPRDLLRALKAARPALASKRFLTQKSAPKLATISEPFDASSLVDAFTFHVSDHPNRPHIKIWFSEEEETVFTYADLHQQALSLGGAMTDLNVGRGDRVAIMLGTSPEFFISFMATLYVGAIPVPIYPPFRPSQVEEHLRRQAGILNNAEARLLLISKEMEAIGGLLFGLVDSLEFIKSPEALSQTTPLHQPIKSASSDVALIQYTSGSTGDPKGVVLTHANLLANIRAMGRALEASSSDVFVSWLPLYHDMGLIGAWLGSMYYGAYAIFLPPLAFLADPSRWLRTIHEHRATLSAAPNFAFELCCKNIRDEQIKGLNLSSIRLIVNGAEPVSHFTIERFSDRFSKYGFKPEMMGPVYGLAENSVGLAFPPLGRKPPVDRVDRGVLTSIGRAETAQPGDEKAISFVACGRPIPGHEIRIVDEAGHELPERYEGQLHFRGPSATEGYFRNPEKTKSLFSDGWLDSGDRAYIFQGDVYITGRVKDMIIKAGRNLYPQEIEEIAGQVEGVRKGCLAAIASSDPRTGTERLVLIVETRLAGDQEHEELRQKINQTLSEKLEVTPDIIEIVPPRTVPKTSSGKIRRATTRELFETGSLTVKQSSLWVQLARLWVSGVGSRVKRISALVTAFLFAIYWWTLLTILASLAWPAVIITPSKRFRHHIVHRLARAFLLLTRANLQLNRDPALPNSACIIVCNHSSYLDSLVISALFDEELSFVAKEELARQKVAGPFLRRLGTIFVRRTELLGSVEDATSVTRHIRAGERIVSFPEGTLTRMPGLLPFRLGPFLSAAQSGVPIIPVALRGTRSILRGEQWFPRKGHVRVWIGDPITARSTEFNAAVALRDRIRAEMLQHTQEPDLSAERIEIRA